MINPPSILQVHFLHPKYWPTWLGFGLMWIATRMPHRVRIATGSFIGLLGYYFASRRRHIIDVNFHLCFPEMQEEERRHLIRRTFRSTGISLIETALVWLRDPSEFRHMVTICGLENLTRALDEGRGVILLGMHLSTLDFCGAILATYIGFDVMYRRNKNKLLEAIMTRGRAHNYPKAIQRDDVRAVVTSLKLGQIVWYGPDQDYGRKHSIFAPFFHVEAASITATSRIARMTGSPVVVFTHYRKSDDSGYEIFLSKPLDNYPADDERENATRINRVVEDAIRRCPEQYWWLHRRFKTQPPGKSRPY
ncbi:MAG: LpxL/LpxP family Kdo(2)-lipid IV(A) lauroyl/palmitoleoyl acyltransferase [Gammaproteobacteria bacterium]|nr:LpxL/LpxP family Kdo(2)-lipid IV(A) lauroyl/palmitoleoyl acyltransferase [Gammaproteobacteria bacterium]